MMLREHPEYYANFIGAFDGLCLQDGRRQTNWKAPMLKM